MENSSPYVINDRDIRSVRLYRGGIALSALVFLAGSFFLWVTNGWQNPSGAEWIDQYRLLLYPLLLLLLLGTGVSVLTIHLYMRQFHLLLKVLYGTGVVCVVFFLVMGLVTGRGLLHILYETPYGTFGFGFVLATLCGIAVKEAVCFGLPEAVLFAAVTPVLVLGRIFNFLSPGPAFLLLCADSLLLCIFAVRKMAMPKEMDIGDKSIYMQGT